LSLEENRGKGAVIPKLLVVYLAFVLYLYLATWLAYLNLAFLPLWELPAGSLLPLVLLGVVAVTLYNAWRKKTKRSKDKTNA